MSRITQRDLAQTRIVLCGAGAIGSNLADALVRQSVSHLRAIDHDRVEAQNVSTQLYGLCDVGVWKVEALRNRLFRVANVEIDAIRKELMPGNARQLLSGIDLIIDAFDNSVSRQIVQDWTRTSQIACVHVGLGSDYGEVIWDEQYRVPRDVAGDTCTLPTARNLVMLVVAVASQTITHAIAVGEYRSWSVTLKDLMVRPVETGVC